MAHKCREVLNPYSVKRVAIRLEKSDLTISIGALKRLRDFGGDNLNISRYLKSEKALNKYLRLIKSGAKVDLVFWYDTTLKAALITTK